jgi:apolipoprotein N-acyltransferase
MQIYLGILTRDRQTGQYRNSLIGLGLYADEYHKRHLVPFGEFFPVPDFARHWMRSAGLPNEDTLAGSDAQKPLRLGDVYLAPTICYEDAYGAEQLGFFPTSNMLINVSNDAWFGSTIAPHQHLQIARMRALETGRFMLRATNTGITAIISPSGVVVARAPQFEPFVLSGVVRPFSGSTPYTRLGNWPVLLLCLALIAVTGYLGRRNQVYPCAPG